MMTKTLNALRHGSLILALAFLVDLAAPLLDGVPLFTPTTSASAIVGIFVVWLVATDIRNCGDLWD